jgi:hypothetical protein
MQAKPGHQHSGSFTFTGMTAEQFQDVLSKEPKRAKIRCYVCKRSEDSSTIVIDDTSNKMLQAQLQFGKVQVKADDCQNNVGKHCYWVCVECAGLLFGERCD